MLDNMRISWLFHDGQHISKALRFLGSWCSDNGDAGFGGGGGFGGGYGGAGYGGGGYGEPSYGGAQPGC